jgi:hypothetical protein
MLAFANHEQFGTCETVAAVPCPDNSRSNTARRRLCEPLLPQSQIVILPRGLAGADQITGGFLSLGGRRDECVPRSRDRNLQR